MKKCSIVLLTFLLAIIGTQVSAWELIDDDNQVLTVDGHMQYRGRIYNLDFNDDSTRGSLNRVNYYGDLSLGFHVKPTDNVRAYFEFNKLIFLGQRFRYNTIQTGEEVMPEDFTLPDGTTIPLERNVDEAWELHMRQAWMDFKVPRVPFNLKFGRQPFMLGNGIYTNTYIASVFGWQFYSQFAEGMPSIRFGSMKYFEGSRENYEYDINKNEDADDIDLFFVDSQMNLPMEGSTAGAFLTYFNDRSLDGDQLSHINLGLTANIKLPAGFSAKGEFDIQTGKKEFDNANTDDIDWNGYGLMLGISAPPLANNNLILSGEFGMGSGDDPDTADEFEGYVGVGPFYPYAFAYEYRFLHWIHNSSKFYSNNSRGMVENLAPGLENTTYLKATANIHLPDIGLPNRPRFLFSPIYLGMTQEGEAFGYEFDNILVAPLYKGFSYMFVLAYVMPSDYMKDRGLKDNAWCIRSQLELTF